MRGNIAAKTRRAFRVADNKTGFMLQLFFKKAEHATPQDMFSSWLKKESWKFKEVVLDNDGQIIMVGPCPRMQLDVITLLIPSISYTETWSAVLAPLPRIHAACAVYRRQATIIRGDLQARGQAVATRPGPHALALLRVHRERGRWPARDCDIQL